MVLVVLASCGGENSGESNNNSKTINCSLFKALQDVFDYVGEDAEYETTYTEEYFISAFEIDGVYYRAIANMTPEVYQALFDLEFDDDWGKNLRKTAGSLEVDKFENLTEKIPTQEELNKYAGKTGRDLFDEGWDYWYYNLVDMVAGMSFEMFDYMVEFEYDGQPMENTDDFDFYEEFADLKIKSVTFDYIGNATWMEEE